MSSRKPVIVVIGGQWGSEGKGMVAAALCKERSVDIAVRTGTVNAGHTVYVGDVAYKMQQLPTSWATSSAQMVLGPGAYINPRILVREIELIDSCCEVGIVNPKGPILIDFNAGLHLEDHTERSTQSGRHHSMGATGKGCSEAVIDKIRLRGSGKTTLFRQWYNEHRSSLRSLEGRFEFVDVSKYLHDQYSSGEQILIEGTQGSHLDLHLGPYPYTTHKQTQAAQWIQEAGLAAGGRDVEYEIVMVVRAYPIRVAGNSGPMPGECSWPDLAISINERLLSLGLPMRDPTMMNITYWREMVVECAKRYKLSGRDALDMHRWPDVMRLQNRVALSELHRDAFNMCPGPVQVRLKNLFEFTTVTQKLRRVAEWNPEVVRQAIRWNGPHTVVLSFWNYWFPEVWGWKIGDPTVVCNEGTKKLEEVEEQIGQRVNYITTGPKTEHFVPAWKSNASAG